MTRQSACHGAPVRVVDGEYVCAKCWQPCDPLPECDADRADVEYEKYRMRCWDD